MGYSVNINFDAANTYFPEIIGFSAYLYGQHHGLPEDVFFIKISFYAVYECNVSPVDSNIKDIMECASDDRRDEIL